jgi:hypothetical protein
LISPVINAQIGRVKYWEPSYRFSDLPGKGLVPGFEGRAVSGPISQLSPFVQTHSEPSYGAIIRDEARPMDPREWHVARE